MRGHFDKTAADKRRRAKRARETFRIRPLSNRQLQVLDMLTLYEGEFVTPLTIGARDQSHHHRTLMGLVGRKLVETKKIHAIYCYHGTIHNGRLVKSCCCKGHRRYKITDAGVDELFRAGYCKRERK